MKDAKSQRDKGWDGMLAQVRRFVTENGRLPEPRAKDDERVLGLWCRSQRQRYGSPLQQRMDALEAIPGWYWEGFHEERQNEVSERQRKAAHKAWKTMRAAEAKMTPAQRKALKLKRSNAAKKAWKTIRAKKGKGKG